MATTDLAVSFYAGNRHVLRFTITDEDTTGSPAKDITGKTLKFAMSKFSNGVPLKTPVLEKSTASGIVITDGTNGECEVTILDTDTAAFLPADYYFELELFEPGPTDPLVVATGTITLLRNITNT